MAAPLKFLRTLNKFKVSSAIRQCHRLRRPLLSNSSIAFSKHIHVQSVLLCNKELSAIEIKRMVDSLTDKFSEARELMDDARESMGTVYFSEDMEDAQVAIKETLEEYKNLTSQLSDEQKRSVLSTLGLRMEELKAQQAALEELLHDH